MMFWTRLVDRVIGQSWRNSRNIRHGKLWACHRSRSPNRLIPGILKNGVENDVGERDPSRTSQFLWKERTTPGTVEQAAVLKQLSTEGLAATLLTHAEESANVDRLLNLGIPLDLAGLFTGPDGSAVLERMLSGPTKIEDPRAAIQLQWPTTTLQFCHDDGSDASSGWRAHLPDLRLIDGPGDGSAADLLPRFAGTIAIAENQTIFKDHRGTHRWSTRPVGPRQRTFGHRWANHVHASSSLGIERRYRHGMVASRGVCRRKLRPGWTCCFTGDGFAVARRNILLFRERDGRSHLLVSTTTLTRNQRLGLTTEESARALQRTFGADTVTPLTPSGFHLDIELCVIQSPEGPVMFVADPKAAAKLLLENALVHRPQRWSRSPNTEV